MWHYCFRAVKKLVVTIFFTRSSSTRAGLWLNTVRVKAFVRDEVKDIWYFKKSILSTTPFIADKEYEHCEFSGLTTKTYPLVTFDLAKLGCVLTKRQSNLILSRFYSPSIWGFSWFGCFRPRPVRAVEKMVCHEKCLQLAMFNHSKLLR